MKDGRIITLIGALALTIAACGSGSDEAAVTDAVAVTDEAVESTDGPSTTNTSPPSTTTSTTSTTIVAWEMDRLTRTAVVKCLDGLLLPAMLREYMVDFGDTAAIDQVRDDCQEAKLQLEVENPPPGQNPITTMNYQVARINLALSYAAVQVLSGAADEITTAQFDDELTDARTLAGAALDQVD